MVDDIDPKLTSAKKDADVEVAVWEAMPVGPQNFANVVTRTAALLQLAWLWLRGRLGMTK